VRALRERIAEEPQSVRVRVELAEEYGKNGYVELELEHLRLAVEGCPELDAGGRAGANGTRCAKRQPTLRSIP